MATSSQVLSALDGLELAGRRCFRRFNTDVCVQVADWRDAYLLGRVERFLDEFESRFSRFLPDSELCRFNRRETEIASVSPEMSALLAECLRLHEITRGVFNPLILERLEALGYDVSFERIARAPGASPTCSDAVPSLVESLRVDEQAGAASLPLELRIEFGGIGKGYAVDRAARLMNEAPGYLIDAGGDIYAAGSNLDGEPWRVAVAHPDGGGAPIDVVGLRDQAIGTSWTTRRRWRTGKGWSHHIIDPRSGLPSESGVAGCSVICERAVDADVLAKCGVILGPEEGVEFLESLGVAGLLVLNDGSVRKTSRWEPAGGVCGQRQQIHLAQREA